MLAYLGIDTFNTDDLNERIKDGNRNSRKQILCFERLTPVIAAKVAEKVSSII